MRAAIDRWSDSRCTPNSLVWCDYYAGVNDRQDSDDPAKRGSRMTRQRAHYTDESASYRGLPNHKSVNHSAGEYVKGDAHIQGRSLVVCT